MVQKRYKKTNKKKKYNKKTNVLRGAKPTRGGPAPTSFKNPAPPVAPVAQQVQKFPPQPPTYAAMAIEKNKKTMDALQQKVLAADAIHKSAGVNLKNVESALQKFTESPALLERKRQLEKEQLKTNRKLKKTALQYNQFWKKNIGPAVAKTLQQAEQAEQAKQAEQDKINFQNLQKYITRTTGVPQQTFTEGANGYLEVSNAPE